MVTGAYGRVFEVQYNRPARDAILVEEITNRGNRPVRDIILVMHKKRHSVLRNAMEINSPSDNFKVYYRGLMCVRVSASTCLCEPVQVG